MARMLWTGAGAVALALSAAGGEPPGGEPSYYLRRVRTAGLAVDDMTPTILSPLLVERVPESCPERLVVVCAKRGYRDLVGPYVEAMGPPGLGAGEGLVRDVGARLEAAWGELARAVSGEPGPTPYRVLVKHYPQDLPAGPCVTIQTAFYSVPDPHLDAERAPHEPATGGGVVPGACLDLRATYLLGAEGRRLIEASLQLTTRVRVHPLAPTLARLLREKSIEPLGDDPRASAHFERYRGDRAGFAWFDRSWGAGERDPWAVAYRAPLGEDGEPAACEAEPLPEALRARLRAFVEKA